MRKTNNELTLKKNFFLMNNKWTEVETAYIYIYIYIYSVYGGTGRGNSSKSRI